jgi:hypothetical protein
MSMKNSNNTIGNRTHKKGFQNTHKILNLSLLAELNKIFSGKQPRPCVKVLPSFRDWLGFIKASVAPWRWSRCPPLKPWRTCIPWRCCLSEMISLKTYEATEGFIRIAFGRSHDFILLLSLCTGETQNRRQVIAVPWCWNNSCHGDRHVTMWQL